MVGMAIIKKRVTLKLMIIIIVIVIKVITTTLTARIIVANIVSGDKY